MPSEQDHRDLREIAEHGRQLVPDNHALRTYVTACIVIGKFLGPDWYMNNINSDVVKTGFFRSGSKLGKDRFYTGIENTVRLAEYLFNLKDVDGFTEVALALRDSDSQSHFAELQAAHVLHVKGVPFHFKRAESVRGRDYDLEVLIEGRPAAAEVKCRNEDDPLTDAAMLKTLKRARDQLPPDRPGIIIYKVPEPWQDIAKVKELRASKEKIAANLFRQTERIVSVIYFSFVCDPDSGQSALVSTEFVNLKHRFDTSIDWKVIKKTGKQEAGTWVILNDICA